MTDLTRELQQTVWDAVINRTPLIIRGGGSKDFLGQPGPGTILSTAGHKGIISYQPTELVLTARAGTPLTEIEMALASSNQMLPFEPPHFSENATFGGAVASGLSGPIRPYTGSVRDFVLGCTMMNGKGQVLKFGGQVMKNVAGYDVSRLMAGAMGTLGLLLEISIKVLPAYPDKLCLVQQKSPRDALDLMRSLSSKNLPLTGLAYDGDNIHIRLAGPDAAVKAAGQQLGGDKLANDDFWQLLREQTHPFFDGRQPLWRLSLPPATPWLAQAGKQIVDWGGGLRWLKSDDTPADLFKLAADHDGYARLFRGGESQPRMPLLPKAMQTLHQKIKLSFDPDAIFNRDSPYQGF